MNRPRLAALAVLAIRVGYGVGLLAAPDRFAGRWLGRAAGAPPTRVALRAVGAREVGIHLGALHAARVGADVRPWLLASVAGDLADVFATVGARDGLPPRATSVALSVGGASALTTVMLAAAIERGRE